MEIIVEGAKYGIASVFKIDLIVWKCTEPTEMMYPLDRFKIDLIVWKSIIPLHFNPLLFCLK